MLHQECYLILQRTRDLQLFYGNGELDADEERKWELRERMMTERQRQTVLQKSETGKEPERARMFQKQSVPSNWPTKTTKNKNQLLFSFETVSDWRNRAHLLKTVAALPLCNRLLSPRKIRALSDLYRCQKIYPIGRRSSLWSQTSARSWTRSTLGGAVHIRLAFMSQPASGQMPQRITEH